ncbi:MAG: mechanosensitive ion channel family protein [Geminicoccaceae bacterium]
MEAIERVLTTYGLSVVGGIVILVIGWIAANAVSRGIRRILGKREKVDPLLAGFFASLAKYLILAFVVIAVLNQFGIQTASLIALLGAAGLAIGLALQGTLGHFAAGVMILIFRPFGQGDFVEVAGVAGTVKTVTLFTTELATPDNVQIVLPNGRVWGDTLKNYSHHETRRVDFSVGIGYGDSIEKAIVTLRKEIEKDERALADPAPLLVVGELADSSVNLTVRVWCAGDDYWDLKFALTKAFKDALDKSGISIPYPQTDVHLIQAAE